MPVESPNSPVTKILSLDLTGIPRSEHDRVKAEIGDILVEEINSALDASTSPVAGGSFKKLRKDKSLSVLLDFGDMRSALEARPTGDGVEVGIFDRSETPKAYGHNTDFEGHPTLDGRGNKREFIPSEGKNFKRDIMEKVDQVLENFREAEGGLTIADLLGDDFGTLSTTSNVGTSGSFTLSDVLFGDADGEG